MASHRSTAAPPHTGTRIDRIGVVAPVNNEEHGLRQCLDALDAAASRVAVPVTVIVVLDSCTDHSSAVVDGVSGGRVESLAAEFNNVGVARAAGTDVLLSASWILPRQRRIDDVGNGSCGCHLGAPTCTCTAGLRGLSLRIGGRLAGSNGINAERTQTA